MAVGHHGWRDGAGWWRLDVLVDYLTIDAFAVAFAVGHVDVVIRVDVIAVAVRRLVNRASVVVRVVRVYGAVAIAIAVDRLIDSAVANIRIEIAVCGVRCIDVGILVDVRHRARIDVGILVDIGHRPRILVDVGVRRSADVVVVVCV